MTTTLKRAFAVSLLALLTVGLAIGAAAPASAHNYLVSSTPAEGETLTVLPEDFVVTTNDELLALGGDSGGFAMQVQDADGLFYGDGCVTVDGPSMSGTAALGEAGDYLLTWQVVSVDGHTVSDEIPFSWAPADDSESSEGSEAAPVCGETTQEPSPSDENATTPPATVDEEPGNPADPFGADLLWIGAAIAAVVIAAGVTMLALSRKKK